MQRSEDSHGAGIFRTRPRAARIAGPASMTNPERSEWAPKCPSRPASAARRLTMRHTACAEEGSGTFEARGPPEDRLGGHCEAPSQAVSA